MFFGSMIRWLCWGLTSQSTIFQSCRDGAIASWVINQYFRGVKCLAQGHNTAAVGLEPRTSRSGVRHSTTEPPRSPAWFVAYRDASKWKWPISSDQYVRQLPSCILQIKSYIHVAIDISSNKFIPWGLNAFVLRMKKYESLYDKLLSSSFIFGTFFGCWQNTFQTPRFNANFLLFLYILTPSNFLLKSIMNIENFCSTHSNYKLTKNYPNIAYFRNYQRISVSIGTNAKCR